MCVYGGREHGELRTAAIFGSLVDVGGGGGADLTRAEGEEGF